MKYRTISIILVGSLVISGILPNFAGPNARMQTTTSSSRQVVSVVNPANLVDQCNRNPANQSNQVLGPFACKDVACDEASIDAFNKTIGLTKKTLAHLEKGNRYLDLGLARSAINEYDQAIKLNPKYASAYNNRGNAYEDIDEHELASSDYRKAIRLNPNFGSPYNNLGTLLDREDPAGAIDLYNQGIRLATNSSVLCNRGWARQRLGNLPGALADFTMAIWLEPTSIYARENRASVRIELSDLNGANADYSAATKMDARNARDYLSRGRSHLWKQELDLAVTDLNQAISLCPTMAHAYRTRGQIWDQAGNKDNAVRNYEKAIELDPGYIWTYYDLGRLHRNSKLAINAFSRGIQVNPTFELLFRERGYERCFARDRQGAIEDFTQAITLRPNCGVNYHARGILHSQVGDNKGAIADFTVSMKLDKRVCVDAHCRRGNLRAQIGEYLGAFADYRDALIIDPQATLGNAPKLASNIIRTTLQQTSLWLNFL